MKAAVGEGRSRGHGTYLTLCPEMFHVTEEGYAWPIRQKCMPSWAGG